MIPEKSGFERDATALLLLLHVASTRPGEQIAVEQVADALTQRGWRVGDGPVGFSSIRGPPAVALLRSLAAEKWKPGTGIESFSPVARALAATVLVPPDREA